MNLGVVLFGLVVLNFALELADYLTTIKGMDKGLVEANPLNNFLFKKIGLPLTTFIEAGLVLVITTIFAAFNLEHGAIFSGCYSVFKLFTVIENLRHIRKLK
jgi:hypothetical protein